MKKLILIAALVAVGACSKGQKIVFDSSLGPRTKDQAKTTPDSLAGDKANASYSGEVLKGSGMEDPDG